MKTFVAANLALGEIQLQGSWGTIEKVGTIPELFWPTGGIRYQMIVLESS